MLQPTRPPQRTLVLGMIAIGMAVAVSSLGVVRAEHFNPDTTKIFKCNSGKACLTGSSSGNGAWGVYGLGKTTDGVHGVTNSTSGNSAVAGIANATSGSANGVYGAAFNGPGVYGTSSKSGSSGVYGNFSGPGYGVFAVSSDTSGAYPALVAQGTNFYTYLFYAHNTASGQFCTIDSVAFMECTGGFFGGNVSIRQRSSGGRHVVAYVSESATPTIEDLGAARLHGGIANVELPADFASVMNRGTAYYVFLTPMGDTRGLYVSMQTPAGFQVRENEHGRSHAAFEYRIIAVPKGKGNVRLPLAPPVKHFPIAQLH